MCIRCWLSHSALGSTARGPGFGSRCRRKCWAERELFVNIYLYEFVLCLVCVCVFVVSVLSYGIEVNLALVYCTRAKPCVMFGCIPGTCFVLLSCVTVRCFCTCSCSGSTSTVTNEDHYYNCNCQKCLTAQILSLNCKRKTSSVVRQTDPIMGNNYDVPRQTSPQSQL